MFFYIFLFIASLLAALVVLWLFHLVKDAGRSLYRFFLSGAKSTPLAYVERNAARATADDTPTPWGWGENTNPSQAARAAAIAPADAVPWGWPGNERRDRAPERRDVLQAEAAPDEMGPKQIKESAIGWPYREEKSELAGTAYKVTRKATSQKTNLNYPADRPWGW